MKRQAADTQEILKSVGRPGTRSSLFWWLFDNHALVVQSADGRRLDWKRLCIAFGEQGLTDLEGNAPTAATARMTWWRVRKEHTRIEALRAAEREERELRAAANPRRQMPSQFPKGDYGPPLATTEAAKPPATTAEQASRGFQLSTAEGVVVTKAGRVFKTEAAVKDYAFEEDGKIIGTDGPSNILRLKQRFNESGSRPINDLTEQFYANCGLRSEEHERSRH